MSTTNHPHLPTTINPYYAYHHQTSPVPTIITQLCQPLSTLTMPTTTNLHLCLLPPSTFSYAYHHQPSLVPTAPYLCLPPSPLTYAYHHQPSPMSTAITPHHLSLLPSSLTTF
ncbi:hypothetical protein HispidOSU_008825 [Sigmodon hispidus]